MPYAVDKLINSPDHTIRIFIDSQAAVLFLTNSEYNENSQFHSCRMKLFDFKKARESIVLRWIPSHRDIFGKEQAVRLAKAGSLKAQPHSALPLCNMKRIIYNKLKVNRISFYVDASLQKK